MRTWMNENGFALQTGEYGREVAKAMILYEVNKTPWHIQSPPLAARFLGDQGIYVIGCPAWIGLTEKDFDHIQSVFPEANLQMIGY